MKTPDITPFRSLDFIANRMEIPYQIQVQMENHAQKGTVVIWRISIDHIYEIMYCIHTSQIKTSVGI